MSTPGPFSVATDELTYLVDEDGYFLVDADGAFLTDPPAGDRWRVQFRLGDVSGNVVLSRYD